jgi:5-formyltetrahydrofolate cyclo-ligase
VASKSIIRQEILILRSQLNTPYRVQASKQICERISQLPIYQKADTILAYFSMKNEVSLYPLMEVAWRQGKRVALPKMEQDQIIPRLFTSPSELEFGAFSVLEPAATCEQIPLEQLDFVIVPGVAFDKARYRLGFGKGHYDRFFAQLSTVYKCGVAFEEQIVGTIYPEVHDIPMDIVITNGIEY